MNIRLSTEDDIPAIFEIYATSKLDELRYEARQFTLLPLVQDTKRYQELMESTIFVYEQDGVLAYGAMLNNEIRGLFVHPKCRSKGIATALLNYMLIKINGPAFLYVAKSNAPAKTLYIKEGFKIADEFESSYNGVSVLANKMVRIKGLS